jgi:hypothetical protein
MMLAREVELLVYVGETLGDGCELAGHIEQSRRDCSGA